MAPGGRDRFIVPLDRVPRIAHFGPLSSNPNRRGDRRCLIGNGCRPPHHIEDAAIILVPIPATEHPSVGVLIF